MKYVYVLYDLNGSNLTSQFYNNKLYFRYICVYFNYK